MDRLLKLLEQQINGYSDLVKDEKRKNKKTDNHDKLTRLQRLRKSLSFDANNEYCTHCIKDFSEDCNAERKFSQFNELVHSKGLNEALFFASNGERLCDKHWRIKLNGKLGHIFDVEIKKKEIKNNDLKL